MAIGRPKKMLNIYILEILKQYSDASHKLSQKDILDKLKSDYDLTVDRKSIKANILDLMQLYPIDYSVKTKMVKNTKTGEMEEKESYYDFYLERDFTDPEIRLLIDSVLFSKNIPFKDKDGLIKNLEKLSNEYFKSKIKHIRTIKDNNVENNKIFFTIDVIDEAIGEGKQISFNYDSYDTDKKLHHRVDSNGKAKTYLINPYYMVALNGKYYLICNTDKYDTVSHYRLDRISNIKILDTPVKDKKDVKGLENGINFNNYTNEHGFMFVSDIIRARFEIDKSMVSDVVDFFGNDVQMIKLDDNKVEVGVTASEIDLKLWAQHYCDVIKVLSPQSLIDKHKESLKKALEQYE